MNDLNTHNHTINTDVVQWFFQKNQQNALYAYSVTSYLLKGLGYMGVKEWENQMVSFCNVSHKTVKRWLDDLHKNNLVNVKRGVLYIKGKGKLKKELNIKSRTAISLDSQILKDKKEYKRILVEQVGLLYQKRARYSHSERMRQERSSAIKGRIEDNCGIAYHKRDVGCSLSYLSNKMGMSRSQVARCLTSTRKVSKLVGTYSMEEFSRMFNKEYFADNPTMFYSVKKNKTVDVNRRMPSVILSNSRLLRSTL